MTSDAAAARQVLRHALELHAVERIEEALAAARRALELDPALAEAHAYLGNTLVTRGRHFAEGIAQLRRAVELRPDDPGIWYTLGWCQEFAADALSRPRGRHRAAPMAESPDDLYAAARASMLRARALNPEAGLKGDIEDILDVISKVTGEPWDDEGIA